MAQQQITLSNIADILANDRAVKVGGCDIDGILRGKLMAKSKFLSLMRHGQEFGFCSVVFGWDMHDQTYFKELKISNKENGYHDISARVDLGSFRRIPWEKDVPFFLVDFFDPDTGESLSACPRSVLGRVVERVAGMGYGAMAGAEYEFYMFQSPGTKYNSTGTARHLLENPPDSLPHLSDAMMGYSLFDPVRHQDWFYTMFDDCEAFNCGIEGWHTESGPGVYEAALKYGPIREMADKAALFKFASKSISSQYGHTPCFMAKPRANLPGNSGHMHVSIVSKGTNHSISANMLAAPYDASGKSPPKPKYEGLEVLSEMGQQFLAGLIEGLPDIMPLFAPTINSYKRLVENFWAPVTVSWGLEHRAASIRIIGPPTADAQATRFEVRVPGADSNPYLALAAILGCGWRGVEKKLEVPIPPLGKGEDSSGEGGGQRLAKSLKEATERFARKGSVAREVFGDDFVDHFAGTREHEIRLWDEAVTDWEVRRYIEMV